METSFQRGAQTVIDMADHFRRLKESVAQMRAQFQTGKRGYFTPTEDEQVRHLLVSYSKSRAALFDLIETCRADPRIYDEADPRLFAVAYAAAVILIDAARFLRETYDDDELVKRKLNEPEPHFGIPADTYDAIQQSLTSPYHAWHMYHANEFYVRCAASLKQRAQAEPALSALLTVIEQHADRVQVSKSRYAAARLRVRARQVIDGVRQTAIGQAVYALQELASRMVSELSTAPSHHAHVPADVCGQIMELLHPGDVFVTRKEHAVTNYFLPGYWPHAALYLGDAATLQRLGIAEHDNVRPRWARIADETDGQPRRVVEALKDGVRIRTVDSPLSNDAVTIIRPDLDEPLIASALARGLFHEGKAYDFDFDFTRSDRLVCTEVVYRSYEGVGPMKFDLTRRAGRLTLAAEDLLRLAMKRTLFFPVACYCPTRGPTLALDEDANEILHATVPAVS